MDIELSGVPLWLVAAPFGAGSVWAVALEDGTTQAFLVQSGRAVAMDITSASLPAGSPAALALAGAMITAPPVVTQHLAVGSGASLDDAPLSETPLSEGP